MAMHNATRRSVPLTWLILDSQLTVDLVANPKMLVNIRKVRVEDAIWVHCNRGFLIALAGLRLAGLPSNEVISEPKISLAFFTSSKVTGKLAIMFKRTMSSKSRSDGIPSRCITRRASWGPL